MERRIVGFRQDEAGDWVAELDCGHGQHVRHDPPWQLRPWVVEPLGRAEHVGTALDCRICDVVSRRSPTPADVAELPVSAREVYADAMLRGLCHEGAWEVAVGSLIRR